MDYNLAINPKKVLNFLLKIIALITVLHLVWQYLYLNFDDTIPFFSTIAWWFNVDYEGTIPSAYSSFTLFVCAFLLGCIASLKLSTRNKFALHWAFLCFLFLTAAWDEATQIHEKFIDSDIALKVLSVLGFEPQGVFAFGSWIVVILPILFLIGLFYLKFLFSLPREQRKLFILGAVIFLSGAVLTELLNSWIWESVGFNMEAPLYIVFTTIEETLEMLGVATFIYSLLLYLENMLGHITLDFGAQNTVRESR